MVSRLKGCLACFALVFILYRSYELLLELMRTRSVQKLQ